MTYRKLQVERDLPVHGRILPFAEVQQHIGRQIKSAQALCAQAERRISRCADVR